ncbi:MAG: hypothetical protein QN152_08995 [Armatimonadota bacterium]|nr:hypothetical protein [Armatimonadota bacterium]MDR7426500.1 hypothetical protein [Armatimonadota bacterium]MDR7463397.1 hypothetical protein [Armatimonadota bacterium]MDR7468548.1 hypothetical protein [Armatimonadota bacterium]MDR7475141.1 hypothetical protein [Armatimonadota bacterium]
MNPRRNVLDLYSRISMTANVERLISLLVVQAYGLPLGLRLGGAGLVWSGPIHAPRAAEEPAPVVRQFRVAMIMLGEGDLEQHRWLPGTIVVNRGDTVILRVTNADQDASHGFAIGGYDIFEPTIPRADRRRTASRRRRRGSSCSPARSQGAPRTTPSR